MSNQYSFMEAKLSTFGQFAETPVTENTSEAISTTTVDEAGAINVPDLGTETETTIVPDTVATEKPAETAVEAIVESDVSNMEIPNFDEPAATTTEEKPAAEAKPLSWKEAIKTADRKEVLKEMGVDDFTIELSEHIAKGGSAVDYLNAKSRDWNKVTDIDIMRDEFRSRYPNLNEEEIERKLTRKYLLDDVDDDVKEDGMIDLKSDAYELRQKRIERDSKLIIPQAQQQQAPVDEAAIIAKYVESQSQNNKDYFDYVAASESTKNLLESKRVVVPIGDSGSFNFSVDKPDQLMRGVVDSRVWNKIVSNEKGEPDVAKLQQIVLFALNPKKYNNDLVSYGKSLGDNKQVEEARNAKKPDNRSATPDDKPAYAVGTYGGGSN